MPTIPTPRAVLLKTTLHRLLTRRLLIDTAYRHDDGVIEIGGGSGGHWMAQKQSGSWHFTRLAQCYWIE